MTGREYVCPKCGFDGFTVTWIRATVDANFQWGCPECRARGEIVWLVETTDPRGAA